MRKKEQQLKQKKENSALLKSKYRTLRLILGDQLNLEHTWFNAQDENVLYVVAELHQEATYTEHHIQKLCAFFAAMSHFSDELQQAGHHVRYLNLDESIEYHSLTDLLSELMRHYDVSCFEYQRPDEFRLLNQIRRWVSDNNITASEWDTEHFLLPFEETSQYIKAHQHNRMESFYRKMRKRFNILMEDQQPLGGQWNYDDENRNKLKKSDLEHIPVPLIFSNPIDEYLQRIKKHNIPYFGQHQSTLLWPVSRAQSLSLLDYFCAYCLEYFGQFQDAMTCQHKDQWSLYHSRLSFSLNAKLLHPKEVITAAVKTFEKAEGRITLPQIEGFIRQILGWREYIRAVYWVNMPDYQDMNELDAERALPEYFWTAKTKMACMRHAIGQSLEYAYAHHIQRLMITGNFCMLTGIQPNQVDEWYLGVYVDAIEWVEMPNTRGMSQFADGGLIATKPYAAGGNYVNKMSDYCKSCEYKVKEKFTEDACPFNSLYWAFMIEHRPRLENNPRIGFAYKTWDKQSEENKKATLIRADWCLSHLNDL